MSAIKCLKDKSYGRLLKASTLIGKTTNSNLSFQSSSFKESLETNPDLWEISCTHLLAQARPTKQGSHSSHPTQFKYAEFSFPDSKVKFLRGSLSKTPLHSSREKGEPSFDFPFSVSSAELEQFDKLAELEESNVLSL